MSNPNPVKQARYAGATDDLTRREKARRVKHMPRVRLAGEALPFSISIFGSENVYRPAQVPSVRPGADDHQACPSRSGEHRQYRGALACKS